MQLPTHARIKVNPCEWKGPQNVITVMNRYKYFNVLSCAFRHFSVDSSLMILPWSKITFALHYIFIIITRRHVWINPDHNCWVSCNILVLENYSTEGYNIPDISINAHFAIVKRKILFNHSKNYCSAERTTFKINYTITIVLIICFLWTLIISYTCGVWFFRIYH